MKVYSWSLVFVLIVEALFFSLIWFYYSEQVVYLFCGIVASLHVLNLIIVIVELIRLICDVACVLLRRRGLGWKRCFFNCAISFVLLGLSSIVLKKLTENV